jgi:uncharacterized protein
VEGFLDELASKEPRRVVKLPRAPGAREARWAHLLCGEVAIPSAHGRGQRRRCRHGGRAVALKAEQARLAAELDALRAQVQRLQRELGIEDPAD